MIVALFRIDMASIRVPLAGAPPAEGLCHGATARRLLLGGHAAHRLREVPVAVVVLHRAPAWVRPYT